MLACLALAGAADAAVPEKPGQAILPPAPPSTRTLQGLSNYPTALLELDRVRGRLAWPLLLRNGGKLLDPPLAVWKLPSRAAQRIVPQLEQDGVLRAVEPDRPLAPLTHLSAGDPLIPDEWWLAKVGADRAEPPGPGVPVTVVDSGLDLSHPEFANRPNTTALNQQTISGQQEDHGTEVSSVVAAPANGIGLVGVYPQAVLNSWDASPTGELHVSDLVRGIFTASQAGRGVISLSLGGPDSDPLEEDVVLGAFGTGSIIVAAAGNEYRQGSPPWFPASYPHVLTVASTNQADSPSFFSSESRAVDIAAPGENIPVAVPLSFNPSGFAVATGTSFSTPIVSGATAWVWTVRPKLDNTQIFDLMRYSARDVFRRGWDPDTGFGVLDIPSALAAPAPAPDPQEPNDDIYLVKPNGLFREGTPFLVAPGRPRAEVRGRLDLTEDPSDVYRVLVPPRTELSVSLRANRNANLELWRGRTRSVYESTGRKRDLIAASRRSGVLADTARVRNRGSGAMLVYVNSFLAHNVGDARYTMTMRTRPLR
jgi:Subtilase family